METKKAIWISDFNKEYDIYSKGILLQYEIKTGIVVPVFSGEHMIAVLFFMSLSFSSPLMELLELLVGRLGLLIIKIDLEREMTSIKSDLKDSIDLSFATLNKILGYRDSYTVNHRKKVAEIGNGTGL